jgi:micrococcal nuclease
MRKVTLFILFTLQVLSACAEGINYRELYRVNERKPASFRAVRIAELLPARVVKFVDGDTFDVEIAAVTKELKKNERIRLLGVDTPETVHPDLPVQDGGREASNWTKAWIAAAGNEVYLAFDWDLRDKYGRLLAYVYNNRGECLNAALILAGHSEPYLIFPFYFSREFGSLVAN